MKIRLWDRLILLLGAFVALLGGGLMVFLGIRLSGGEVIASTWQMLSLVLGCLSLVISFILFTLFKRYSNKRYAFVVQHTDNGELRIAVAAIENLVKKCIDMHEEIHANHMQIRHSREGVTVDLAITLANNISIPLAVASLQKQIKQYLVASSGIDVKEVRVCVESTQITTDDSDSPYLVPAEAPAAPAPAPAEPVKKEKKMPLHRRLFCKADQAATVPEPPKAQEAEADAALPQEECAADLPQAGEDEAVPAPQEAPAEETPAAVEAADDGHAQDPEKEEGSLG